MCAVRRRVLKSLPVGAGHARPSTFPAYRFILILYSPVVKIAAHGAAPLLLSFLSYLLLFPETTMKILMISNHLGVQSGVQRYVQNLLLHLDTAKYRVTLFVGQCPPDQASTAPALEAHGVEILAVPDNKKDRIRCPGRPPAHHKDYDIIHYHTASKIGAPVCGMMRLLCPRAKIVVHSHIVYPPLTLTWRAAHGVYQLFADYFLGCGVAAGRFVFGDHIDEKPNFSVACNAVDAGRFHPDAAARAAMRANYGIADTDRLAGFVGRLNHQKNPLFLMEVFAAMAAQDVRWKLMLVGTGEKEPEMRAAAEAHGLADRVIFAGVQSDVPAFMNAFDLFLLPSNFEGSPGHAGRGPGLRRAVSGIDQCAG